MTVPQPRVKATERLLLGGYAPLALILVVLALLMTLVPSKVPASSAPAADIRAGAPALPTDGAETPGAGGGVGPAATAGTAGPAAGGGVPSGAGGKVTRADNCPGGARQAVETPYAPPCTQFSGSNGGATAPGVTGDTITVAVREGNLPSLFAVASQVSQRANIKDNNDDIRRAYQTYIDYFNSRFQLYGRKIKLVFYKGQGDQLSEFFGGNPEAARADALKVRNEIKAFADLSVLTQPYAEALVQQKVIAIPPVHMSRSWYRAHAPYAWGVLVDCTTLSEGVVDYAAKRFVAAGGSRYPARYAGDAAMREQPRRFALIIPEQPWYRECGDYAERRLKEKTGQKIDLRINYTLDFNRESSDASNIVAQLKANHITTVMCACDPILPLFLTSQATQQDYRPEWFVTGTALTDVDLLGQIYDQDQWAHAFGVGWLGEFQRGLKSESYRVWKVMRPNDDPPLTAPIFYYIDLLLSIGIQMAGPDLTPATFQQGLFAYPPTRGEAGLWHFGPDDYTATDDAREFYYDPKATSPFNGEAGRYVTANGGSRFSGSGWPAGPPAFPIAP